MSIVLYYILSQCLRARNGSERSVALNQHHRRNPWMMDRNGLYQHCPLIGRPAVGHSVVAYSKLCGSQVELTIRKFG